MIDHQPAAAVSEPSRIHFETLEKRTFLSGVPQAAEFHLRFAVLTRPWIREHVEISRGTLGHESYEQVHTAIPRFHVHRDFVVMFHIGRPHTDQSPQPSSERSTPSHPPLPPPQNSNGARAGAAPVPAVSEPAETPPAPPVQQVSHQTPRVQKVDRSTTEATAVPITSSVKNPLPMVLAPSVAVVNSLTRAAGDLLHGDAIGAPAKIASAPRELTSLKLSVGNNFGCASPSAQAHRRLLKRTIGHPASCADTDQNSLAQKIGSVLTPTRLPVRSDGQSAHAPERLDCRLRRRIGFHARISRRQHPLRFAGLGPHDYHSGHRRRRNPAHIRPSPPPPGPARKAAHQRVFVAAAQSPAQCRNERDCLPIRNFSQMRPQPRLLASPARDGGHRTSHPT